jgi:transcriptional regulator with XRE-family HTH domain
MLDLLSVDDRVEVAGAAPEAVGRESSMDNIGKPIEVMVGRTVRAHRIAQGLSPDDLAKRVGISAQALHQHETGNARIDGARLQRIAAALALPVETFFAGIAPADTKSDLASPIAMLAQPYALRMLRAYCDIEDLELRRSLVELAEKFAIRLQPSHPAENGPAGPVRRSRAATVR